MNQPKDFLKIGITGGIGSGKTTVSRIIEELGYPVFYSDIEAKALMTSNAKVIAAVKKLFGEEAYAHGNLNRTHLARVVFDNPSLLKSLNAVIHPEVRLEFESFCERNKAKKLLFNEAAILFETGAYKTFDFNVLVTADANLRIQRVIHRDNVSKNEVLSRMKNQWSDELKRPLADFIIFNNQEELMPQIQDVIESLMKKLT